MADVKVANSWKTVRLPYARVAGQWRPCKQIYAKVGGQWKIAYDITAADPFDGSGSLSGALTPGYVPWEVVSGTWTKSGGAVSADSTNRVAALTTGTQDVEVEIDTVSTTTGGPGVAFWIEDQSNWWGVRFYTEEYTFTFFFTVSYNFYCTGQNITRNASNMNPASYAGCSYFASGSRAVAATGRLASYACRECRCPTVNTCAFVGVPSSPSTCGSSCSTTTYPNSSCTNNTRGTFCRVSSCGNVGSCPTCPVTSCPTCSNISGFTTGPCPPGNPPDTFSGSFGLCSCTCIYTGYQNTQFFNPATYNCPQTVNANFAFYTNNDSSGNFPFIPNCTFNTNNVSGNYTSQTCIAQFNTFPQSGNATAVYKRGQLVRSIGGSVNIIATQDFGDVGNLYAKTYGNTVDYRQYSGAGRTGSSSNVVTYNAGSVTRGSKHGILVTSVPFSQNFSIGRFKVTL